MAWLLPCIQSHSLSLDDLNNLWSFFRHHMWFLWWSRTVKQKSRYLGWGGGTERVIDSLCRALYIGSSSSSDGSTFLLRSLVPIGFPGGAGGKEPTCQCRRHKRCGLDPWVRKIPWRRAWKPTPVLPGESHGPRSQAGYSLWGRKESDMIIKWLSMHACTQHRATREAHWEGRWSQRGEGRAKRNRI